MRRIFLSVLLPTSVPQMPSELHDLTADGTASFTHTIELVIYCKIINIILIIRLNLQFKYLLVVENCKVCSLEILFFDYLQ